MILDILSTGLGANNTFVVDNTLTEKAIVTPPAAGAPMNNNAAVPWFERGDNLIITGFWVGMPFGFGQGSGIAQIFFSFEDGAGAFTLIPELANPSSGIIIPSFCGPLEFPPGGLFVKVPTTGATRFRLNNTVTVMNISQINAPAILQGTTIQCRFYLQVLHTLPMQALA